MSMYLYIVVAYVTAVCVAAKVRTQPALMVQDNVGARWHDPSFFGGFSEAESTYDEDGDHGNPQNHFLDGWEPAISNPYEGNTVRAPWFHESPSGGPLAAWQTHYPGLKSGMPWARGVGGSWNQQRWTRKAGLFHRTKELAAGWFDYAAENVDGFGRQSTPTALSPRRFISWQERSVNTTLKCADPGCTAKASLQAFNGNTERGRYCKLDIGFKATDYDGNHTENETVEWVSVNGAKVSLKCKPFKGICNDTEPRPFYPCVANLNLDRLMPPSGTLNIVAKISAAVKECPYKGSLLYAVPMVSCLVTDQIPAPYHGSNDPLAALSNVSSKGTAKSAAGLVQAQSSVLGAEPGGGAAAGNRLEPGRTQGRLRTRRL